MEESKQPSGIELSQEKRDNYKKINYSAEMSSLRNSFVVKNADRMLGRSSGSVMKSGPDFLAFYESNLLAKLCTEKPEDETERRAILDFISKQYSSVGRGRNGKPSFGLWYDSFPTRSEAIQPGITFDDPRSQVTEYLNLMLLEKTKMLTDDLIVHAPTLTDALQFAKAYPDAPLYGLPSTDFVSMGETLKNKYFDTHNKSVKLPAIDSFLAGRFLNSQHAKITSLFANAPEAVRASIEQKWQVYEASIKDVAKSTLFTRSRTDRA